MSEERMFAVWHNDHGARRSGHVDVVRNACGGVDAAIYDRTMVIRRDLICVTHTVAEAEKIVREHEVDCARCRAATAKSLGA